MKKFKALRLEYQVAICIFMLIIVINIVVFFALLLPIYDEVGSSLTSMAGQETFNIDSLKRLSTIVYRIVQILAGIMAVVLLIGLYKDARESKK